VSRGAYAAVLCLLLAGAVALAGGEITGYDTIPSELRKATAWLENSTAGVGAPNVLLDESNKTVTNIGASALAYNALPSAEAGLIQSFICADADGLTVTAGGGDRIIMGDCETIAGGTISTVSTGVACTLVAIDADRWVMTEGAAHLHSWTVDGAPSGHGSHGRAWISATASTDAGSEVTVAGTFSDGHLHSWTRSGGVLTYAGRATLHFFVAISVNAQVNAAGDVGNYTWSLAQNEAVITGDVAQEAYTVQAKNHSTTITTFIEADTGDTFEILVKGPDGDSDITAQIGTSISVTETGF